MLKPWKKLEETIIPVGHRTIIRRTFELPDGKQSIYDITGDGDVVCILALTPEQNIVLVRQFRPGPEAILLELPGGFIDPGQTPAEAARAELLQETGYDGDIEFVTTRPFSGYSNRLYHSFVATNCRPIQEQMLDPEEFLEVVTLSLKDFREHLKNGWLVDTVTGYAALDKLNLL